MFTIESLTHGYGDRVLFQDISWQVTERERCALVGPNGAGKTTILRVLAGQLRAEAGEVRIPRGAKVGYLPQEGVALRAEEIVIEEAMEALGPFRSLEAEIAELHDRQGEAEGEELERLSERAGALQHRFEELGGYGARAEAARVLAGLGISQDEMRHPIGELSGGWQMRVALAKLVLSRPDLLLLDEPTNHLDIESVRWLEGELLSFRGAVVIVTHDRYLLERLATRVVELQGRRLEDYRMDYGKHLVERERRREAYEKTRIDRQQQRDELTAWIERFRYKATKARQVQSRIKGRDRIELLPPLDCRPRVRLAFPAPPRSGRVMLEAEGVGHRYGEKTVLSGVGFSVERGDKIGVVGVNGVGKSTLLRLLVGQERATAGDVLMGAKTIPAFLAQDQSRVLEPARTVQEELLADAEQLPDRNPRTILGAFLFSGDDIDKKVSVLSGGEKGRLGLAKLLLRRANLLLLDEPTNHLDMVSRDILVQALREYRGAALLVSHDRSVLDRVCTKTLYLSEGRAMLYPGTWSELEAWREARAEEERERSAAASKPDDARRSTEAGKEQAKPSARASAAQRKAKRRLEQIELRIKKKEARTSKLEESLCDPELFQSPNGARYTREYQQLKEELEMLYGEWEETAMMLEE
ncbi:MAG: ABC transporter ATP-binding protein [Gemmatimonadetes bacterium]|nr:ABC transporter ATP-binding protein [Gemmatimonadota bacterium]